MPGRTLIKLVLGGFEPMRRTIASMRISNMSSLADCSDYRIEALEAANGLPGDPARNAECMVLAHDRRQSVCLQIFRGLTTERLPLQLRLA